MLAAGAGLFGNFSSILSIPFLSPSLLETARYCLKDLINPSLPFRKAHMLYNTFIPDKTGL